MRKALTKLAQGKKSSLKASLSGVGGELVRMKLRAELGLVNPRRFVSQMMTGRTSCTMADRSASTSCRCWTNCCPS